MTTENHGATIRRIQKLLAIAGDDRANPAEAAAAAGMAERIMRKYQIDHADVIVAELRAGKGMATSDHLATAKTNGTPVKDVPGWAQALAVSLARLNDCGAQTTRGGDRQARVRFFGYQADVQVVGYMFDYLVSTVNRLCVAYRSDEKYIRGGRKVMHSYRTGVVYAIIVAVDKLTAERARENEAANNSRALVVVKQGAITETFGNVFSTRKGTQPKIGDGFLDGVEDGSAVDVKRRAIA